MSKYISTYFTLILVSMFLAFTTVNAQDSIQIPDVPTPLINPPATIVPETEVEIETATETTPTTTTTTYTEETYYYEDDIVPVAVPKKVTAPKPDPELLAALDNNPFALIRDGKVRRSTKSSEKIPTSTKVTETVEVINQTQQEVEIEQEEIPFVSVDTTSIALDKQNPFRLEGTLEDRQYSYNTTKIKFNPKAGSGTKTKAYNPIFDTSKVNVNPLGTLKFIIIIIILGFLSIIVTRFKNELADIYKAFLSGNLLSLLYREKGTILRLPYFLLYVLASFSFGTMLFLILNQLGISIFKSNFLSIIACIFGVGGIFILRHFTLTVLSYIFPFKKEANLYGFTIAIFNFVIGIALLPFIILIAFAPENSHTLILYLISGIIGSAYLFRTIRSLIIANKYLLHNKFHFFMYLCTIEIAPLLILLKLAGF